MRCQLWKNPNKKREGEPDYIVFQKQRLNDGTTAYETNEVGFGIKMTAPSGETYIDINLPKYSNNNKPKEV